MAAVAGVTVIKVIVFTGFATVTAVLAVRLSKVAVTVTEPTLTAVASPEALMVAMPLSESDHAAWLVTFFVEPSLYFAVAVNWSVAPTETLAAAAVTEIVCRVGVVAPELPLPDGEPALAETDDPPHPLNTAVILRQREKASARIPRENMAPIGSCILIPHDNEKHQRSREGACLHGCMR